MPDDQPRTSPEDQPNNPVVDMTSTDGQSSPAKETSYFIQALLGFATSMIFLLWTLGILFATHGGWFSLVPFLIFIGLCFYIKRHWPRRGFTVGTLIGLGLTILVVGLCGSVVTKSLRKMQQRHDKTTPAPIKNGNK